MEESFESVDKSVDLDDPSEHSVDLDDPGKDCSKEVSDDLPSDSSLGRLMDSSQDHENEFQLVTPKVEFSREDDMADIHVDKSQDSQLTMREVNEVSQLGGEVFEKEVGEEQSISDQQSSGEEYGGELSKEQRTSLRGREGRRCSARLQGKTRKRWTSKNIFECGVMRMMNGR